MGHLNQIQEDFDAKGLTILSVTGQDRADVVEFVEELDAKDPIICKADSAAYSTGGIPSAYLIGADGTVLWQGHPASLSDSEIESGLKKVAKKHRVSTWAFTIAKNLPELPEAMSGIDKLLEKMKFGAALKKADQCLAKMEGDDKESGQKVRDFIAARGEESMKKAAEMVRERDVYEAYLLLEKVKDDYKGHALSKQAKDQAKAIKSGSETKLEFKAAEKFAKIKKEMKEEKDAEDKLKVLKPMLSKKYASTKAGEQAAEMATELEGKVEK